MAAQYGIIGYPLTHTFSPGYFNEKFRAENIDAAYHTFPLHRIEDITGLLRDNPGLNGLNVTIPYKKAIIPFLDVLDAGAQHIMAVNCIDIRNGIKKGYNTDAIGFRDSLKPLLQPHHTHALVLGTGGASLAVKWALYELGIQTQSVSRTGGHGLYAYADLDKDIMEQHTLVVNTTPLGMSPNTGAYPNLPYHLLTSRHLLYDLVYNPAETLFLQKGKEQGAIIKNGLEMLYLQAEAGWKIWQGQC